MTRVLSELLGAPQPGFTIGLQQLERSAGGPNADIRLTTEIRRSVIAKISELGLDPQDTSGHELYRALGARLKSDEKRFLQAILKGVKISEITHDPTSHVASALHKQLRSTETFALKNSAARKLLKANVPKKVMKVLGFRSAESMLKHESAANLFAAASLIEADLWTKKMLASYAKLKATDFETRPITIENPSSERWQKFSQKVVADTRHTILSLKELGTVVILPLPDSAHRPSVPALTTAVIAIHAVNEVLAVGSYLKLHQARADFGTIVKESVLHEPVLQDRLLDRPVSWNLLQQYYARLSAAGAHMRTDIFEPFLAAQDMVWHGVEQVLARIEPSLEFWQGTAHLGHLDAGQAISCNLTDSVLSHCNNLPFNSRVSNYFRNQLTTELLLRYLDQDRLERSLAPSNDQRLKFAPETAII